MRALIMSSLAVLLGIVCVHADDNQEKEVATSDEAVSSDVTGSFYKDFGCSSCGGKTKK